MKDVKENKVSKKALKEEIKKKSIFVKNKEIIRKDAYN